MVTPGWVILVFSALLLCHRHLLMEAFSPQHLVGKNHVHNHHAAIFGGANFRIRDDILVTECGARTKMSATTRSSKRFFATISETSEGSPSTTSSSTAEEEESMLSSSLSSTSSWEKNDVMPDMDAFFAGFHTPTQEVGCAVIKTTTDDTSTDSSTSRIIGNIPSDLRGTFFKVGPAMFYAGSLPIPVMTNTATSSTRSQQEDNDLTRYVTHPFDADGAIFAATFCDGNNKSDSDGDSEDRTAEIAYRYRYIRTNAFDRERKKRKKLYDGMEATRTSQVLRQNSKTLNDYPLPLLRHHFMPGLNKQRKNTSNTNVIYWANKLLSFWEGGLPYKLDGLALSTDGKSQLGGALGETTQLCSKTVIDAKQERLLLYALQQEPSSSTLTTYEFDKRFKLIGGSQRDWKLPGYAIINDGFACTNSWNIVLQPPIVVNGLQYLLNKDPSKCVTVDNNSQTLLHLLPRSSSGAGMVTISIPPDELGPDLNSQIVNAYEEEGNKNVIVLDLIRSSSDGSGADSSASSNSWQWPLSGGNTLDQYQSLASSKTLWRYRIDVKSRKLSSRECLSTLQLYFGTVHPKFCGGQKHTHIYATVGADTVSADGKKIVTPPQGIVRINCDTKEITTWMPQPHEFCGQPTFAPRRRTNDESSSESSDIDDDGYLLTTLFNGKTKTSELLIFDAAGSNLGPPMAHIPLSDIDGGIPHGHYGWYSSSETSDAGWSSDEIERRSKLADKMETKGNRWNEVKSDFSGLGLRLDDWEEYFGDIL